MVAQCADSTALVIKSSQTLDIIVEDHQHQRMPNFIFGTNMMQLLHNLLSKAFDRGHFAVIEQLWCYQDSSDDFSHYISILLNELCTTRHCSVVIVVVRILARLLRLAPDQASRERLHSQMEALRFDELLLSLRHRFCLHYLTTIDVGPATASSSSSSLSLNSCSNNNNNSGDHPHQQQLLAEAIEDCLLMYTNTPTSTAPMAQQNSCSGAEETATAITHCRTDADSGTFSAEEDEEPKQQPHQQLIMMKMCGNKEDQQQQHRNDGQQQLDEIVRLVHTLPAHQMAQLAKFLRTMITTNQSISTSTVINGGAITHLGSNGGDQQQQTTRAAAASSESSPPVLSTAVVVCRRSSSSSSPCFPPAPPPPPPAASLVRPPPPPLLLTSPAGGYREHNNTHAAVQIPSALRPKALPDQCRRLRHLQWTKLPTNAVAAAAVAPCANVWQTMEAVDKEMRDRLDLTVLDAFFGCPSNTQQNNISDTSHRSAPSSARRRSSMMLNGGDCVTLLDAKRSLSVNVFLKMCRDSGQLLKHLAEGQADKIGADRLRTIAHLLPSAEEQKMLRDFSGDRHMLGAAEQFLLELIECIPAYRLRVEAMLFKLDLEGMLETNRPHDGGLGLKVWLKGCQELLRSSTLRKVLYALLHLGNYLNHGAGAGNAVGFRLSSLWKVEDVKTIGGTRGRTLLHFVAQQVDNCAQELGAELESVREAAKSSLEAISDDVRGLLERMHCLEEGIARTSSAGGDNFLDEFLLFLDKSRPIIASAEHQLTELGTLRLSVASFLCEQERNFSLEECFKVIAWFVTRFEKAVQDNLRFVEKDQHQLLEMGQHQQQLKRASDSLMNGMALKSVTKKSVRHSIALVVDERERQQQQQMTPCPSSPGRLRRRRTAHSVTPLLDSRPFLNGLEEDVERTEVKRCVVQSLDAVVDQALMRNGIATVGSKEIRQAKMDEEKDDDDDEEEEAAKKHMMRMAQQQAAANRMKQMSPKEAMAIMPVPPQQTMPKEQEDEEGQTLSTKTVPSALATMSMKAKKHLHRSLDDAELSSRREDSIVDGKMMDEVASGQHQRQQHNQEETTSPMDVQAVTEERALAKFGGCSTAATSNNSGSRTTTGNAMIKSNCSRMGFPVRVAEQQQQQKRNLPVSKRAETLAAAKAPPAVCRIRMVTKPPPPDISNGHIMAATAEQSTIRKQQQTLASSTDRPLRPSQVKASQQKMSPPSGGGIVSGTRVAAMASAAALKGGSPTAAATSTSRRSTTITTNGGSATGRSTTCANASNSNALTGASMRVAGGSLATKTQTTNHQKQQQNHTPRASKPTLTRRLSTSSRPTLVHSIGRSGSGNRDRTMSEKPKWL